MTTPNRGVGKFTTLNLVSIFRAVPESTGTYADVTRAAADHGGDFQPHTIAIWVQAGNADIRDGNTTTAYARFAKIYSRPARGKLRSRDQPQPRAGPGPRDHRSHL